jgi:hypothetical protein
MSSLVADEYQQYRAPQENESATVIPSQLELVDRLKRLESGEPPQSIPLEFCGKSWEVAREQARREAVDLAMAFTAAYRELPSTVATWRENANEKLPAIVMSGHQPELFHAGVWFKNFLISQVASQAGAIAINFLVDNDLCRNAAIRVPSMAANGSIIAQSVPFDSQRDSVPWELRRLNSRDTWDSFADRVLDNLLPRSYTPLLSELWPHAIAAVRRCDRLGLAIAEARHKLEEQVGLQTLEIPSSSLVGTRAFARFSIQLLSELPRFQAVYNHQLANYRVAHHIRNHAHPVPTLEQSNGWLEAPWWVYRTAAPQRQKMWVRLQNDQLLLSDRAGWQAVIEGRLDCDQAASQWMDFQSDGICLRPRALLTTMYMRMFISDLFVHGIGGGKYDQLTDAIMREFFGVQPPLMAVATATMRLPITSPLAATGDSATTESELRRERESAWQLKFHADQLPPSRLDGDNASANPNAEEIEALTARKQALLANIPPRGEKWEWHREITAVNKRLSELAAPQLSESRAKIDRLNSIERQQRVLESREYSFSLFPRDMLATALHRLSK